MYDIAYSSNLFKLVYITRSCCITLTQSFSTHLEWKYSLSFIIKKFLLPHTHIAQCKTDFSLTQND